MKDFVKTLATKPLIVAVPVCLSLFGCMKAVEHHQELADTNDRALTLGLVQKQVQVGTSQSQVAMTLGSPNIVTRDNNHQETWIYDKIASEASYSQDSGGVNGHISGTGLLGTGTGSLSGALGGDYNKRSGAASITQRTLTVVLKFDSKNSVESVSYHSSKF